MLKKIALGLIVVVAAILIMAATRPDTFRVERSISIDAPPEKVYALVSDFHNWGAWSPWEKLDPKMTRGFSGAASGLGAVYDWEGNDDVGKGRMEITKVNPPTGLTIKLDFLKPFEAYNTTEYVLKTEGGKTTITWSMYGPATFMTKLMGVFVSMDSMVGKDFETGLANLKALAEKK